MTMHGSARRPTLVKLGGELLEEPRRLKAIARQLVALSTQQPTVVVHGGGREVDAEMARLGLAKRAVDGLRITDAATLDVVLGVLAGRVNTRLVSAINAHGGSAVGLTGVDAGITRVQRASRYRAANGSRIDLGLVGVPIGDERPALIGDLVRRHHIPVVASLGSDARGGIYNVNADTLAGDLASRLRADCLVIAGTTAGVLDANGRTIAIVDDDTLARLIGDGQASAGMVAKLLACREAKAGGVRRVAIVDGTRRGFLDAGRTRGVTTVTAARIATPPRADRRRARRGDGRQSGGYGS